MKKKTQTALGKVLTQETLLEMAGNRYFARGESYFAKGHVNDLASDEDSVTALLPRQ
ncbi:MAG: hypothetical protein MUF49_26335 [Oculatellaceae cyanobacterium Prado106]|jgi:uncharacterized Zn finger protein|nr:hypothetical protein [Oculatellaceae cyanobacterium Prado106]